MHHVVPARHNYHGLDLVDGELKHRGPVIAWAVRIKETGDEGVEVSVLPISPSGVVDAIVGPDGNITCEPHIAGEVLALIRKAENDDAMPRAGDEAAA